MKDDKRGVLSGRFLYGGDYNPEQWLQYPEILARDAAMMKKAHINAVTLGVFSWAALEPQEGRFELGWLEKIVAGLYSQGICVVLATPSGARPRWLAEKYPEVLRMDADRRRNLFGERHNHCYTSPIYRDKVRRINQKLAEAFADHPAVLMWHISNEYGGACHCPLCQEAFRTWLAGRYGSIDVLNHAWWSTFWSHSYSSFSQIESPSPRGDLGVHGLNLDWKRFVTAQTADFLRHEVNSLREAGARQPVTVNLMEDYTGLDYAQIAPCVDIISWDSYPRWHRDSDSGTALETGMQHDLMRTLGRRPFLLMESCPGAPNWHEVSKAKRPGMIEAASLQAVAHGSDSVLYFQIRQGRGGGEKFHGAVIDHYGGDDTRTFREVTALGATLQRLGCIAGTEVHAEAAVLWDTQSRWAMEDAQGPRNDGLHYHEALLKAYGGLRRNGFNTDMVNITQPLNGYRLVVAPMLYMLRDEAAGRLADFVHRGGTLIVTYWSGVVNETDLCFLGPAPHGLTGVLGLRREEIDALYDGETNILIPAPGRGLPGGKSYSCRHLCEIVRLEGAVPLLQYADDFYRGRPALTVNSYGSGRAYYVAADAEADLYTDLIALAARDAGLQPILGEVPDGIEVTSRTDGRLEYVFVQNFTDRSLRVRMPDDARVLLGERGTVPARGTVVLERPAPDGSSLPAAGYGSGK